MNKRVEHDITGRLKFLELNGQSGERLRQLRPVIEKELPVALDKFYDKVARTPETRRFFSSEGHMVRAKSAQIGHWNAIANGVFDDDYSQRVHAIGSVHARIDLAPRWYIGGYGLILEHLIGNVLADNWPKGGFLNKPRVDAGTVTELVSTLVKAVLLDMDLSISVYIEQAELAKQAAQREAIESERNAVVKSFGTALSKLAGKDLDYRLEDAVPEAYLGLKDDFNSAIDQLAQTMRMIEKAEAEKQEAQRRAIDAERATVVETFGTALSKLAGKDLDYRLEDAVPDAYLELKNDFNSAIEQLAATIRMISTAAGQIMTGSNEIKAASSELARSAETQAAAVEETAAAVEQIASGLKSSTGNAEEVGRLALQSKRNVEQSSEMMDDAIGAMTKIDNSSSEIASIVGLIDEIAFQTNLLAINAGVEAARAKEAGTGFAVIAKEVRELAQRTTFAAKDIKKLIDLSIEDVKSGSSLVNNAGTALKTIVSEIHVISENIQTIVVTAREQSTGLGEINSAVGAIDHGTQRNASMAEETTAATHSLGAEVERINNMLAAFRLGQETDAHDGEKPALIFDGNASPARKLANRVNMAFSAGNAAMAKDEWEEF